MTDQTVLSHFNTAVETLRADHWTAWRMGERESYPIYLEGAETLPEAVAQAMCVGAWKSGDKLAVLYTHAGRNERTLTLYAIKVSTTKGMFRPSTNGGRQVFVGRAEPKLIFETAVQSFAPVEPFDAFRDDPTGRDSQLVEGVRR